MAKRSSKYQAEADDAIETFEALADDMRQLSPKAASLVMERLEREFYGTCYGDGQWPMTKACDLGNGVRLYLHCLNDDLPLLDDAQIEEKYEEK